MGARGKGPTQRPAGIHRAGFSLTALALSILLVLAACDRSAAGSVATATPSRLPTPTLVPTPAPTALPTAAPVGHVAGWQTLHSEHWVGYTFSQSNVTGVRAQWQEPKVNSGTSVAEEFVWIGIGGWGYTLNNIIQVGTFAYFPSTGGLNQGIWYELVPIQQQAQFPLISVNPGDQMFASVDQVQSSQQSWQLLLIDLTTGATFRKVVQFDSLTAYPSFVVEDPNNGPPGPSGPFYNFPHWGTVTFSNMQVRVGSTWMSAAALYGDRIVMVRNGQVLANAGPLNANSSYSAMQV